MEKTIERSKVEWISPRIVSLPIGATAGNDVQPGCQPSTQQPNKCS